MDTTDMADAPTRERPKLIAVLAVLQLVGSAILLATILLGYKGISETLSGTGLSWRNLGPESILTSTYGTS